MTWFYIALLPPLLFAVVNHFDKYLVQRFFKGSGVGAVLIFSALIGAVVIVPLGVFVPGVFDLPAVQALAMIANGFIYLLASLPYFYALAKDEASVVVPIFQLVPFFVLLLAFWFLGERITTTNLLGGIVVVVGAVLVSLELRHKKVAFKKSVFWLMVLSSVLFALSFVLFKNFAIESSFLVTSFWEYLGFTIFGLLTLALVRPYRKEFLFVFKKNRKAVLAINGANELIAVGAKGAFNFASLLVPVALVSFLSGLQPLFVFLIGTGLTLLLPKISKEKVDAQHLAQKILAIVVILAGVWLLNSGS